VRLALRALLLLAAVTPVFAATAFHPAWWQVLLAAAVGSALGQLAVRTTRDRRVAQGCVAGTAVIVVAVAGAWSLRPAARHDDPAGRPFLIVRSTTGGTSTLTWDDVHAIQTEIATIDLAVPTLRKTAQLISGDSNWSTQVVGTTPDYFDLWGLRLAAGERFDGSASNKVVVLGDTVVAQLYGAHTSPVGEVIRIKNIPFTVVGVLAHQGTSPLGQDLDDVALVPIGVYAATIETTRGFGGAVLITTPRQDMARVETELRSLLRDRHRLTPGADDDFVIRSSNPD
jgi:putative ABC transport system permease protein